VLVIQKSEDRATVQVLRLTEQEVRTNQSGCLVRAVCLRVLLSGFDPSRLSDSSDGTEERVNPVGKSVGSSEEELVVEIAVSTRRRGISSSPTR